MASLSQKGARSFIRVWSVSLSFDGQSLCLLTATKKQAYEEAAAQFQRIEADPATGDTLMKLISAAKRKGRFDAVESHLRAHAKRVTQLRLSEHLIPLASSAKPASSDNR